MLLVPASIALLAAFHPAGCSFYMIGVSHRAAIAHLTLRELTGDRVGVRALGHMDVYRPFVEM